MVPRSHEGTNPYSSPDSSSTNLRQRPGAPKPPRMVTLQTSETRPLSSLAPEPPTLERSEPIPPEPLTAPHVETPPIHGTIHTPIIELEMLDPAPPRMATQQLPDFTKHRHRGPTERLDPRLFGIDVSDEAPSRNTVDLTPEQMQRNMDRFPKSQDLGHEPRHVQAADSGQLVYAAADSGQRMRAAESGQLVRAADSGRLARLEDNGAGESLAKNATARKPARRNDSQIVWKAIAGVMLTIAVILLVLALS